MHVNTLSRLLSLDDLMLEEDQILEMVALWCEGQDTAINIKLKKNEKKSKYPAFMKFTDLIR